MESMLPLPRPNAEDLKACISSGLRQYFTEYGVTTIGEISETVTGIECMNALAESGDLPTSLRIYLWSPGTIDSLEKVKNWRDHIRLPVPERDLRNHRLKLFSDAIGAASCGARGGTYVAIMVGCVPLTKNKQR